MELRFGCTEATLVIVWVTAFLVVFQSFSDHVGWELGPAASDAKGNKTAGVRPDASKWGEVTGPESTPTLDRGDDPTATSKPARPGPQGCILYMDDRRMNYTPTKNNSATFFEEWGAHLPYWVGARFINRAYARRHGYRFVTSTGKEFWDAKAPRATSWLKVLFMKQQLQCCCQWVFFLDSDAYFRMDNHELSIESWLGNLTSKDYFQWEEELGVNLANQTWFPEDPLNLLKVGDEESKLIGAFPRNGDNLDGYCGGRYRQPDLLFPDASCRFAVVNAGVVMMRNSSRTLDFLDRWWNDDPNKSYRLKQPWEQAWGNMLFREYNDSLVVVPFREMTGIQGLHVRHYWHPYGEGEKRDLPFRNAVLSLVAKAEEEGAP